MLGALFFGFAAYAGILLAGTISMERFEDGPAPGEPPVPWIVGGAAIVGAIVAHSGGPPENVPLFALAICALAAVWCTDVRYGVVPDAFTLAPLAAIAGIAFFEHRPWTIASAIVLGIPFAAAALLSNGRGMGWGDVKLAALGGAVLGAQTGLLALSAACIAAVLYTYLRGRRHEPIAFAPYLAASIAVAMPLGLGLAVLT